jgi:DNA polymerase III epsilon subunit-like protein
MNGAMQALAAEMVAIDFETTGAVPGFEDEPWQIGMVRIRSGTIVAAETFDSLLRIGDRPFSPYAPGRHQQLRPSLARAPSLQSLFGHLRGWWFAGPLVAHNAPTERKVIRAASPLHRAGPWIDTLKLARVAYPDLASHSLEDLLEQFGLMAEVQDFCPGRDPHDALFDAVGCARFLIYLLAQEGWDQATLNGLAGAHPERFYRRVLRRQS